MAYGREQIMKALKYAGDLDAKYAQAVGDRFGNSPVMMGSTVPLRDVGRPADPAPANAKEQALAVAMRAGVGATNVASRYALPLGGMTAAGVGLYELTTSINTMGDQQSLGMAPM